jgi:hypothetical protein
VLRAQVDYLLWWMKRGSVGVPLATTTEADVGGGAAFTPRSLFGPGSLGTGDARSGLRARVEARLTDTLWIEGSGFLLERDTSVFRANPAATLSPAVLARPFTASNTGAESQNVLNLGDLAAGSIVIPHTTKLYGAEVAAASSAARWGIVESAFAGYRYLALREQLAVTDRSTAQVGGLGFFNGLPVPEGDTRVKSDLFQTHNDFHGVLLGATLAARNGIYDLRVRPSVSLGVTQQVLTVQGQTTSQPLGGQPTTLPGGLLALPSNSRQETKTPFTVVPELEVSVGCQILPRVRASVGYNFLYCSSAARPGDQVDGVINPAQLPISPNYDPAAGGPPGPAFRQSSFWAHGLSFEVQVQF